MALPVVAAWQTAENVGDDFLHISLEVDNSLNESSVEAWSSDYSSFLGHSCSYALVSGPFETYPVSFQADETGDGNITIGSSSYIIHENATYSGGISCVRVYSFTQLAVSCTVPVQVFGNQALEPVDISKRKRCHSDASAGLRRILAGLQEDTDVLPEQAFYDSYTTSATGDDMLEGNDSNKLDNLDASLGRRQRECGIIQSRTRLVDNGNPHQNPLNIQLTVRNTTGQHTAGTFQVIKANQSCNTLESRTH